MAQQLQMLWPDFLLTTAPAIHLAPGYVLRSFTEEDAAGYLQLMHAAGFSDCNDARIAQCLQQVLPDGWFVIVQQASGDIVATAMATHNADVLHPYGGELGWVAASPSHAGKGLGLAVCAAVVRRFLAAGYRRIYLKTDDFRLPAIKSYLKLGFVPLLFDHDMEARWHSVCCQLNWPFTPHDWPQAPFPPDEPMVEERADADSPSR